jgi:hypothetical protein
MRNILGKGCRGNQHTHLRFNTAFRKSCVYEIKVEKFGGGREATNYDLIWRIRVACWTSKAARTHTPTRRYMHTHVPTCARTHTQIRNIYCFPTARMIFERALVIRHSTLPVLFTSLVRTERVDSASCKVLRLTIFNHDYIKRLRLELQS